MDCYRGNFVLFGSITYLKCLKETHFSERPIPDTTNPNRTDPSIGSDRFGKFYRYRPIMSILAHIYQYVLLMVASVVSAESVSIGIDLVRYFFLQVSVSVR